MSFLEIDGVRKTFSDKVAVDGVSLAVDEGAFLTLLGPSGSGKSTLLMMLAGFVVPTTGRVRIGGRDVTDLSPERRGLGLVFQGYALFPHMSVFDNVAFPLKVRRTGRREIEQRVGEMLDLVQLAGLAHRLPAELSGGQQQRVALARALSFDPPILLLDEPLSALDRLLRQQLQHEIKRLHRSLGKTFVFVTHDQDEALALSTDLAILRDGRIEQFGPPDDLYARPATAFVAGFLGTSNLLHPDSTTPEPDGNICNFGSDKVVAPARPDGFRAPVLTVRAEAVRLITGREAALDGNAVAVTIREADFQGDAFLVDLATASGLSLKARIPARDIDRSVLTRGSLLATWRRRDGVWTEGAGA